MKRLQSILLLAAIVAGLFGVLAALIVFHTFMPFSLLGVVMIFSFFYIRMRSQTLRRKFEIGVKFVISMIVMMIISTWAWDAFVNGKIYDSTDGGSLDYWNVGDWVSSWDNHPIAVVHQVANGRSMEEPDEIKEGWSVTGLWCLWFLFFGISLVISILFAWMRWVPLVETFINTPPDSK
jgi:hypothetical protein